MDANDQRLIEGLFARIDRLVAIMEGKYCPESNCPSSGIARAAYGSMNWRRRHRIS